MKGSDAIGLGIIGMLIHFTVTILNMECWKCGPMN